jgi:hypothetical protein
MGFKLHGALLIGVGMCCVLNLLAMMPASSRIASELGLPPGDFRWMLDQLIVQSASALWLVTLGLGVFRGRRWACDLALATCFLWLAMGVLQTFEFVERLPQYVASVLAAGGASANVTEDAIAFSSFLSFASGAVLLPAVLVWFFSGNPLRSRVESSEPPVLDAPLPVVVLGLYLLFSALQIPPALAFNGALPVFNTIVTGAPGMCLAVGLTLSLTLAGVGVLQNRIQAWHVAVGLLALLACSTTISAEFVDGQRFAETMGINWVLENGKPVFWTVLHSKWTAAGLVAALAYAIFVRRFFPSSGDDAPLEQ